MIKYIKKRWHDFFDDSIYDDVVKELTDTKINRAGSIENPGNKVQCLLCKDIIQSMYRHDFKWCKCESIAVDGGGQYLKLSYTENARYKVIPLEIETKETND